MEPPEISICANCGHKLGNNISLILEHTIEHVTGNTTSIIIKRIKKVFVLVVVNDNSA